jgi:hypothetical protein
VVTDDKWYPTTPRRPRDPVKTVVSVLAGLGGGVVLWALALMAIFAGNPDRPASPGDTTTPVHASPTRTESTRPTPDAPPTPPPSLETRR